MGGVLPQTLGGHYIRCIYRGRRQKCDWKRRRTHSLSDATSACSIRPCGSRAVRVCQTHCPAQRRRSRHHAAASRLRSRSQTNFSSASPVRRSTNPLCRPRIQSRRRNAASSYAGLKPRACPITFTFLTRDKASINLPNGLTSSYLRLFLWPDFPTSSTTSPNIASSSQMISPRLMAS